MLEFTDPGPADNQNPTGSSQITNLSEQTGEYMCQASNPVGTGRSQPVLLDVKCEYLLYKKVRVRGRERGRKRERERELKQLILA